MLSLIHIYAFKVDDSIYDMSMPDFSALINPDDISAAFDTSMFDSMDSSVFNPDSFGDISSAFGENGMDFDIGSIDADTLKKLVSDSLTDEVKASISEVLYGFKEYMSSDEAVSYTHLKECCIQGYAYTCYCICDFNWSSSGIKIYKTFLCS